SPSYRRRGARLTTRLRPVSPSATGKTLIRSRRSAQADSLSTPARMACWKSEAMSESQRRADFFGDPKQDLHRRRLNGHLLRPAPGAHLAVRRQADLEIDDDLEPGVRNGRPADELVPVAEGIDVLRGGPDDRENGARP